VATLLARLDAAPPGQYLVVGHPAFGCPEMHILEHAGRTADPVR
jgi:hypothetical protein